MTKRTTLQLEIEDYLTREQDSEPIVLVSCCGPKLAHPAPAVELYTSQLFHKSIAYARSRSRRIFVISALYGLVALDQTIAPYDRQMSDLKVGARRAWGLDVVSQLAKIAVAPALVVLAGELYVKPIRAAAALRGWPTVEEPLAKMEIGQRLRFLTSPRMA